MKPIQIIVPGVTVAVGLVLCIALWRFAWLADRTLIALLAGGVVALLWAGYMLLCTLQQSGTAIERLAIESAQLKDQVKVLLTQAHHDHLTGLGNRNLLADRFQFAMERSMRGKESFALLMVDLNNFKSINDNYGHSAGDEVLVASARRLVAAVRASDTVVRLGGDEFLLLIERFGKCNDVFNLGQKLIDSLSE
jgi:GGDEF domain-containing protein